MSEPLPIPPDPVERTRRIGNVLLWILGLNWLVAGAKIAAGFLSGNVTVLADGFHSLLDGANNIVGFVAIRLGERPPDDNHPYGHRSFENVASMAIGGLVVLLSWETLQRIVASIRRPAPMDAFAADEGGFWYLGVVVATLIINVLVARGEHAAGVRYRSPLLKADAAHTQSDAAVTLLSIASLLLAHRYWWIDPLLATVVVVFLLRAAWGILGETIMVITEAARLDPMEVRTVAESVDGVIDAHAIRSHGTENAIHLDLHIHVNEQLTARQTEEIEVEVRRRLTQRFPELTLIAIKHETEQPNPRAPIWDD